MKLWPFHVERRTEPRREVRLEASFLVRDDFSGNQLTPEHPALIVELSPRGCCLALTHLHGNGFHLHHCLEAPQDFPLVLRLNLGPDQETMVRGEVRWINREMGDLERPFRVGLRLDREEGAIPLAWRRLSRNY